jgi:hypothetical protein
MRLRVNLSDSNGTIDGEEFEVKSFLDADKIGGRVGRVVRDHIRSTPFRGSRHRTSFFVDCWWEESAGKVNEHSTVTVDAPPRPKRKKKARK